MTKLTVEVTEVESAYLSDDDRFVVSLIVGYSPETDTDEDRKPFPVNARQAAAAALRLTQPPGSRGTQWFVFDRLLGTGQFFEQSEFHKIHVP